MNVEWVDELIHRAIVCRDEARRNGNTIVEDISQDRINSLLELRHELPPEPREPSD